MMSKAGLGNGSFIYQENLQPALNPECLILPSFPSTGSRTALQDGEGVINWEDNYGSISI
ncbi:MAG: hypothetical protein LBC27_09845 [Spirochaetaceae bacterium]|jgi:hypothetical protein|nr:hypothetical protein [Spirochaetaceae bacterium]